MHHNQNYNRITCAEYCYSFFISFNLHSIHCWINNNHSTPNKNNKKKKAVQLVWVSVKQNCQLVSVKIVHISCRRQSKCVSIECCIYCYENVYCEKGKKDNCGVHTKYDAFARNVPDDGNVVVIRNILLSLVLFRCAHFTSFSRKFILFLFGLLSKSYKNISLHSYGNYSQFAVVCSFRA